MEKVKVSPKYQIVIPKRIRAEMNIRSGQELFIYILDGALRLEPSRSVKELRGMAKGIKWRDEDREHSERF